MPRSMGAGLLAQLKTEATALATLARITRRDGTIIRLTSFDQDIVVGAETFVAADGYDHEKIEHRAGTKVDETEFTALLSSSAISKDDIANGLYSYALVELLGVYWPDPSLGTFIIDRGRIGPVTRGESGAFKFTLRSITERLLGGLGRTVTPECGWSLGDPRTCKIPLLPDDDERSTTYAIGDFVKAVVAGGSAFEVYGNVIFECTVAGTTGASSPTWDTTPGNTTSDGTVTWKCYEAWTRHGVVAATVDNSSFNATITESRAVDEWFTLGGVYFLTGDNVSGRPHEVQAWVQSSGLITLAIPTARDIQVGDKFRVSPGCDLVRGSHCRNKFIMTGSTRFNVGNAKRFGGYDSLPGRQFLHQNVHAGK